MDWSTIITASTFSPIVASIESVMPFIVGFAITLLGIRKVWGFVKSEAYSA